MATATVPHIVLNATDRCDRCGAKASVRAVMPLGGELMFCAHHLSEYRATLDTAGATLHA